MSRVAPRVTEEQVRRELLRMEDQSFHKRVRVGALVALALAVGLGALVARFLFVLVDVRTDAMAGALESGDVAVCVRSDAPVIARAPQRGSLVLVGYSDNGLLRQAIRRVVAVAGDEISLDAYGQVTLNGEPLSEEYAGYRAQDIWADGDVTPGGALENPFSQPETRSRADDAQRREGVDDMEYPLTVPEGKLFVLCDSRDNLLDSRSSSFGLVTEADVKGLVRAVIWPVYRAGILPASGI